jgi:putative DNA methylase
MELGKETDGGEVLAHLTLNVPDYYADATKRDVVLGITEYIANRLGVLRPGEASAARILSELIKTQRLG